MPYSLTALSQATLLFKIASCLKTSLPDDEIYIDLAKHAILSLADYAVLSQPYQKAGASPFSSESIGSYSYSKMAAKARAGQELGVPWFDLAIQEMGVCNEKDDAFAYGGIEMMEHDGVLVDGASQGNQRFISPQDRLLAQSYGVDPEDLH
jgi:hypothetical protein